MTGFNGGALEAQAVLSGVPFTTDSIIPSKRTTAAKEKDEGD